MKKPKIISGILLISLLIAYLVSCKKESAKIRLNESTNSIQIENRIYPYINLKLRTQSSKDLSRLGQTIPIPSYSTEISHQEIDTLLMEIQNFFSGDIQSISETPKIIVLFTTDTSINIHFDSLRAISVFLKEDNVLLHKYFQITNNSNTEHSPELDQTCSYFALSELDLLSVVKFDTLSIGWALFSEYPNGQYNGYSLVDNNNFGKWLIDHSEILRENEDCNGCGGGGGSCEYHGDHDGDGNPILVCDACRLMQLNAIGLSNELIADSEQVDIQSSYDFRDNFLQNSEKERTYIDYYYKLSYISKTYNMITLNNFFDHLSLANHLVECARIIQYGDDNEIPITSTLRDEAYELIDVYRQATNNTEYQEILDQIQSDLNTFQGKTRTEILETIE